MALVLERVRQMNVNYLYGNNYIQDNDKLNNFLIKNELILKIERK